ncbi:peptide chain release factor 1 [Coxiella endosymbiont of Amblyomma americanum]|uniref:peptide chain release factor 1 n=1 Tax=Coxiella endosymbiont of Amblyomma americanum TaxID=325775 RepID=UPI0005807EEE|nr:peptide chain release factor 1 [Coxiella endosymbiont of Amblyomma americanum]AJC50372.1 peptide chain release factor 1 [Coxiella endosymbiont of Amblyomma americanum]AUJ58716.1 peptide chain release factor 1 [Coxiella-like endosymbiont of Amblyomma americanum]
MKVSLIKKLKNLSYYYNKVSRLLSDPDIISNQDRYRALGKEYAQLEPIVKCFRAYEKNGEAIKSIQEIVVTKDLELKNLAEEELKQLIIKKDALKNQLRMLLIPKDPNDEKNIFLEVRVGTGGSEAAIFAGELFRMYARYAEKKGWHMTIISAHEGECGGFKEIIARVVGERVYSQLKFESGVHRVQRVPITESQGRIHTSACTVAVMPEVEMIDAIKINPTELRIDTFRASGAGGQHVNRTDSAIRITHIPTGVVVECQDERSQHKNRARAMSLLQSKLLIAERSKQAQEQSMKRKSLIGSGDRSARIRTYNFPKGRVTDHQINLTLYQLNEIMEGNLDSIIDPLIRELQAQQLTKLNTE